MITRRKFLATSALAAGSTAGFPHLGGAASTEPAATGQKPGRIIHLVADGMSQGTLTCADYFSLQARGRGLTWLKLMQEPGTRNALMNMRSLNSMVTDSSAASSSWGSGSRVVNGAVNKLPGGRELTTLYELFANIGWKRGLVTTTEITHATPAGFAACVDSRSTGGLIAEQYLKRQVDVLLGGGRKIFDPKSRADKRNLRQEYAAAGYQIMETALDLAQASADKRWLGLFHSGHLPFTLDEMGDPKLQARVPTLAAMTRRALQWLGRHEHFILQVEGGRVDHAAHNCDAPAAMREMLAFDEALDAVLEFQRQRPDTLVVITTDHGTGNMGVNGSGNGYGLSSAMFRHVAGVKASFAEIMRQLRRRPSETDVEEDKKDDEAPPAATDRNGDAKAVAASAESEDYMPGIGEIREVIGSNTGYDVSKRRAGWFQAYLAKRGTCVYELMNKDIVQLGQLLANHIAVGWAGNVHTADYVPLTASGPGAERFEGFIQNVDVFRHYTQLAGIDFKNPEEPLLADADRGAAGVENVKEYELV